MDFGKNQLTLFTLKGTHQMSESTQTQTVAEETYLTLSEMLAKPEEELALNPDRDPFTAPRVPEGWFIGTVDYREKENDKRWIKKTGQDESGNDMEWYATKVLFKISKNADGSESEYEGRTVSPAYGGSVTTKLRKNNSSVVSGICLHAGLKVEVKTHAGQAAQLDKVIAQALPVKAVIQHELSFSVKEGDKYIQLATIRGSKNPEWPKTDEGELDYSPTVMAFHDPNVGWRLAQENDPADQLVEVAGRVNEVVDRFAPITK